MCPVVEWRDLVILPGVVALLEVASPCLVQSADWLKPCQVGCQFMQRHTVGYFKMHKPSQERKYAETQVTKAEVLTGETVYQNHFYLGKGVDGAKTET